MWVSLLTNWIFLHKITSSLEEVLWFENGAMCLLGTAAQVFQSSALGERWGSPEPTCNWQMPPQHNSMNSQPPASQGT